MGSRKGSARGARRRLAFFCSASHAMAMPTTQVPPAIIACYHEIDREAAIVPLAAGADARSRL